MLIILMRINIINIIANINNINITASCVEERGAFVHLLIDSCN